MKKQTAALRRDNRSGSLCGWLVVSTLLLLPHYGMAQDQTFTLQDGGSTATVDATPGSAGMNSWTVDTDPNVNQLDLQWFYYSINGGSVQAIDQMPSASLYTSQPDSADLSVDYYNTQVGIDVTYSLQGSGSGSGNADISESIAINNLSNTSFSIQFYQFSHFNLLQDGQNNLSIYEDGMGGYNEAYQSIGSTALAEGIIQPDATGAEAGSPGQVMSDILHNQLTGNYNTGANLSTGPGDVSWAFEWDTSIDGGGEYDITKDKTLSIAMVPEPSSIALIALGLGAFGLARRRHS